MNNASAIDNRQTSVAPALTPATVEESWNAIVGLTGDLHGAAANEDWQRVLDLAAARHHNLLAHFGQFPVGPDNAEFYRTQLTPMLNSERELQRITTDARREVMRAGLLASRNSRAVGAYLS